MEPEYLEYGIDDLLAYIEDTYGEDLEDENMTEDELREWIRLQEEGEEGEESPVKPKTPSPKKPVKKASKKTAASKTPAKSTGKLEYKGRDCVGRKSKTNDAWTKEELLEECKLLGLKCPANLKKEDLCIKLIEHVGGTAGGEEPEEPVETVVPPKKVPVPRKTPALGKTKPVAPKKPASPKKVASPVKTESPKKGPLPPAPSLPKVPPKAPLKIALPPVKSRQPLKLGGLPVIAGKPKLSPVKTVEVPLMATLEELKAGVNTAMLINPDAAFQKKLPIIPGSTGVMPSTTGLVPGLRPIKRGGLPRITGEAGAGAGAIALPKTPTVLPVIPQRSPVATPVATTTIANTPQEKIMENIMKIDPTLVSAKRFKAGEMYPLDRKQAISSGSKDPSMNLKDIAQSIGISKSQKSKAELVAQIIETIRQYNPAAFEGK